MSLGRFGGIAAVLILIPAVVAGRSERKLNPVVEVEEGVYTVQPADNGAGPLWCYGSTCLVRVGADVYVSGLETIPGARPLNNVRWFLTQRTPTGWKTIYKDEVGRTREPCPLAAFPDGRLFLSANPTLAPPDTYSGPAHPQVVRFSTKDTGAPPETLEPRWEGQPAFTEHSYRGFCADGLNRELLLFNILGYDRDYWSFYDRAGRWSAAGTLEFPFGAEYEKPEPIRLCYPELALKNRAAHMLAISDIIEPVKAWRDFKRQLTGREWDYEFRRLFYSWTPDLINQPFSKPLEIASREQTCGYIQNLDLWLDTKGRAHALWLEKSVWYPQMRDRFFPGTKLTTSLETAMIDHGKIVRRVTLAKGGEGASSETPAFGRFHALPNGRLFVLAYFNGTDPSGKPLSENRLLELRPDGTLARSARVPLQHPFTNYMTATERGGSPPSDTLDILGEAAGRPGISYARIRIR